MLVPLGLGFLACHVGITLAPTSPGSCEGLMRSCGSQVRGRMSGSAGLESFPDTEALRAQHLPWPPWQQVATLRLRSQAWDFTEVDTVTGAIRRSQLWE